MDNEKKRLHMHQLSEKKVMRPKYTYQTMPKEGLLRIRILTFIVRMHVLISCCGRNFLIST